MREVVLRGDRGGLNVFLTEAARIIAETSGATPEESVALILAHEPAARALYLSGKSPRAIASGIARIVERAEASRRTEPAARTARRIQTIEEDGDDDVREDDEDE